MLTPAHQIAFIDFKNEKKQEKKNIQCQPKAIYLKKLQKPDLYKHWIETGELQINQKSQFKFFS